MIQEDDAISFSGSSEGLPLIRTQEGSLRRSSWLGLRPSSIYLCIYVVWYVGYLAIGAAVFSATQQPVENHERAEMSKIVENFLRKFPTIPG